jgi:hypothetical protein|tara:strand:- start:75 stop:605 length:531 start_codon:yes stop_codon:yes gene_type:complete
VGSIQQVSASQVTARTTNEDRWANITFTLAVTGSKTWTDQAAINETLDIKLSKQLDMPDAIVRVINGGQQDGVDAMVRMWAATKDNVAIDTYRPRWNVHATGAVSKRNWSMVNDADAVMIFDSRLNENDFLCEDLHRAAVKTETPVAYYQPTVDTDDDVQAEAELEQHGTEETEGV